MLSQARGRHPHHGTHSHRPGKKKKKNPGVAGFHTCVITSQFRGLQEISPGVVVGGYKPSTTRVQWKANISELLVDVKLLSDLDGTVKNDIYLHDGPKAG